jgi:hypothetical protein
MEQSSVHSVLPWHDDARVWGRGVLLYPCASIGPLGLASSYLAGRSMCMLRDCLRSSNCSRGPFDTIRMARSHCNESSLFTRLGPNRFYNCSWLEARCVGHAHVQRQDYLRHCRLISVRRLRLPTEVVLKGSKSIRELSVNGYVESAIEQLIRPDRNERTFHRQLVAGAGSSRRVNSSVRPVGCVKTPESLTSISWK